MDDDVFQVRFSGNAYTGAQRVADFCLLRCSELALQHGYAYFAVIDSTHAISTSYYTTPLRAETSGTAFTSGTGTTHGRTTQFRGTTHYQSTTRFYGGQTRAVSKPASVMTIICFRVKPSTEDWSKPVLNAEYVYNSITGKYSIRTQKPRSQPPTEESRAETEE